MSIDRRMDTCRAGGWGRWAAPAALLLLCGFAPPDPTDPSIQSIREILRQRKVSLHAEGSLLLDVAAHLARETGIEIGVEVGIEEAELSGVVDDLPLGKALDLLLGSAGLEYELRGDGIFIRRDPEAPLPPEPEPEPPPPTRSAEDLVRQGDLAAAERQVRERLTASPADIPATLLLAELLERTGRYVQAVEALEEVSKSDPEEKDVLLRLGRLHIRMGRYAEAEERLQACGDRPAARVAIGTLYLDRLGKRDEGRQILEKVISRTSNRGVSAEGLTAAGEASAALGRFDDSTRYFNRAVEADEEQIEPYLLWGEVFLHKYRPADAVEMAERALKFRPASAEARVLLARCHLLNPTLGSRRYAVALSEIDKALAVNPALPEAHVFLADIAIFDGDLLAAVVQVDKVLELNPRSIPARARLGAVHLLREEEDSAQALEEEVLRENPLAHRYFLEIADIIESRFRYREAADLAQRAIDLEPQSGEAHFLLGMNLVRLGEMEKGEAALRTAQKLDTNLFVRNALQLIEDLRKNYETTVTDHFVIRTHRNETRVLLPYVRELLEEAREKLGERYGFFPKGRVVCEVYSDHASFSIRTMGMPWVGALGVCFGSVIAIDSPLALPFVRRPALGGDGKTEKQPSFAWARTLWHEYAHVVTLQMTGNRVPRWLTEGLSVLEEGRARPGWSRKGEMAAPFFTALGQGRLLGVGELNRGFTKPEFGGQVMLSYFQGAMVCEYIEDRFGIEALRDLLAAYSRGRGTAAAFQEVLGIDLAEFDEAFFDHCRHWMESTGFRASHSPEQLIELRRAFEASPQDGALAAKLSQAYFDLGRIGQAEILAARAMDLDPSSGDALAARGWVMLRRGRRKSAAETFDRALEAGCGDPLRIHLALADIAERRKDSVALFEHLEAARELFPMDPSISGRMASLRLENGPEEEAIPDLVAASEGEPADFSSRQILIQIYSRAGRDEEVARLGREAIGINPFDAEIHYLVGESLRKLGRGREALREYDVAIALEHPLEGEIASSQAELLLEAGERDRARERAQRALELEPSSRRAKRVLEALDADVPEGKER